ncbi:MAG: hypothetical protein JRG81_17095 [Deltaproteobacteria bacterium]|nr:hypothetical protein [Deltaproteobacteria bacterium]
MKINMDFTKGKEGHMVVDVLIRRTFDKVKAPLFDFRVAFLLDEKTARSISTDHSSK